MNIISLFLIGCLFSEAVFASDVIVLQMEVSHPRNKDQTSVIFRKKTVEFVTNTNTLTQRGEPQRGEPQRGKTRLGRFQTPLNQRLKLLKKQIQIYHKLITSKKPAIDMSKFIKPHQQISSVTPHASVIRLKGKNISAQHPYFKNLQSILKEISQREKWSCISCAEYQKKQNNIVRVMRKSGKKTITQTFSTQQLNCFPSSQNQIECVDPLFGIFEIGSS